MCSQTTENFRQHTNVNGLITLQGTGSAQVEHEAVPFPVESQL